jgi:hypothetical protein
MELFLGKYSYSGNIPEVQNRALAGTVTVDEWNVRSVPHSIQENSWPIAQDRQRHLLSFRLQLSNSLFNIIQSLDVKYSLNYIHWH